MGVLSSLARNAVGKIVEFVGVRNVTFEATQDCNQDCTFCYNVWKSREYPGGTLDTERTKKMLDHIISDYRPLYFTLTGGEPLLRPDLLELVRHVSGRTHPILISNGTLMNDDLVKELVKAKVSTFEFTLLSADREVHNSMVRRRSFDQVVEAIASVKAAGGHTATVFVATKDNIGTWKETIELNVALGVSGILFNRFNVGGAGIAAAKSLMPSVDEIREALSVADDAIEKYGISISCGVPIPQCVIDREPYKKIRFGDCPVGTKKEYPTVDALGNVRPCNHSPRIYGNVFETSFSRLIRGADAREYSSGAPEDCAGCVSVRTCRGGCRAAAEVCGECGGIDPFVSLSGEGLGENDERQKCGFDT